MARLYHQAMSILNQIAQGGPARSIALVSMSTRGMLLASGWAQYKPDAAGVREFEITPRGVEELARWSASLAAPDLRAAAH